MKNYPNVSILIVNYNGAHLLPDCLSAVANLDYPKKLLEVIVIDNNSKDNSLDLLKKNFPTVKVVAAKENLGFTGGNNLGYEHATGDYIVLLNNDTRVERKWLKALVTAAEPKNIGIVSSKLLFDTPFLELELTCDIVSKSSLDNSIDFSPVGIIIEDLVCKNTQLNNLVWYESGFYDKEHATISSHWCKDKATILIPFQDATKETYKITGSSSIQRIFSI